MNATISPFFPLADATPVPVRPSKMAFSALAAAAVVLITCFDCLTGDFTMGLFYLGPVAFATWYAGRGQGWCIALLSTLGWLVGDLALGNQSAQLVSPYWSALMIGPIFGAVVQFLSALHRRQRELKVRVADRTAALAKANEELQVAKMHLIEAAKLECVGRLAASVVHEVKNPLMTINLVANYLADLVPADDPEGRAAIEDLHEGVKSANRVICEMLDFVRPAALALEPVRFSEVAERALGFVKHEIALKELSIGRDWCQPEPHLCLDRNKMQQVLINVLLNAVHATPRGGTLTLRSKLVGKALIAEIEDTGCGIDAADSAKLFEPFFTTKPAGEGTGLGLPVAREIVRLHGGDLLLGNRPDGSGARATIRIPSPTAIR